MVSAAQHLIIMPILIPLVIGASLLFFDDRQRNSKAIVSIASLALVAFIALSFIVEAGEIAPHAHIYQLGNWPSPFSIVLVLDRLSAVMVLLSSVVGLASLIYAQAHWHKTGRNFHALMQFLMMGVNGACLTGDLFNLFVFFEVMLTASYGLALHHSTRTRVRAGLHYVVVNLVASALFLIGVAVIYAITGSLNMADIALKLQNLAPNHILLFQAGATILAVAFLIKAGMWPLNFWLTPTYSAVVAPVGGVFAILSKVGIYVILRLSLLIFSDQSQPYDRFGFDLLFYGGLITVIFGFIGVLASQTMGRLAGYSVLISSGTLLAALGISTPSLIAGALFYLIISTLALCALFLLVELVERSQDDAANVLAVTAAAYGEVEEDEEGEEEVGKYLPFTLAIIGVCFCLCAMLLIGMPPMAGFIGKFMMITSVFNLNPSQVNGQPYLDLYAWYFTLVVVIAGLATLIATVRMGIRSFWGRVGAKVDKVLVIEIVPIAGLIGICIIMTIFAGPISQYLLDCAQDLFQRHNYIDSVLQGVSIKGRSV